MTPPKKKNQCDTEIIDINDMPVECALRFNEVTRMSGQMNDVHKVMMGDPSTNTVGVGELIRNNKGKIDRLGTEVEELKNRSWNNLQKAFAVILVGVALVGTVLQIVKAASGG